MCLVSPCPCQELQEGVTVFRCRQWCGDAACGVRLEDWRRAGPRLCLYWLLATAQARLSQAPATAAATCLAIHLASKQGGPACLARPRHTTNQSANSKQVFIWQAAAQAVTATNYNTATNNSTSSMDSVLFTEKLQTSVCLCRF